MAQPPSFPFYPADWLLGTLTFSLAEDGAYLRLVMHQWNAGSIPGDDLAAVARILRVTEREARVLWGTVGAKFVRGEDGLWRNARVEKQRAEKVRYHEAKAANGAKGGRPPKNRAKTETETEQKPTGSVLPNRDESLSLALALSPEPTAQRDARAAAPFERPKRPNPYAHAQVQAPDGRSFWQGPIFSIPDGWARKTIAAANGRATGSDVVLFAQALTERLQREGGEAPTQGFLGWLDAEWTAWRASQRADAASTADIARTKALLAAQERAAAALEPTTGADVAAALRRSRGAHV